MTGKTIDGIFLYISSRFASLDNSLKEVSISALSGTHISSQIKKSISAENLSEIFSSGIFISIGNITKFSYP